MGGRSSVAGSLKHLHGTCCVFKFRWLGFWLHSNPYVPPYWIGCILAHLDGALTTSGVLVSVLARGTPFLAGTDLPALALVCILLTLSCTPWIWSFSTLNSGLLANCTFWNQSRCWILLVPTACKHWFLPFSTEQARVTNESRIWELGCFFCHCAYQGMPPFPRDRI